MQGKNSSTRQTKDLMSNAIELLQENEQEIIKAIYFENTSLHALSRTLKIPRSTLRYRKKKALLHLKTIIENSRN